MNWSDGPTTTTSGPDASGSRAGVIEVRRTDSRFETRQPGIVTEHCFSSGAHYDPANTHFGAMVTLDEHAVAPGAGFARHAHRGVDIVSWVLAGTLRHEDSAGRVELVRPGTMLLQSTGPGIEHAEGNASQSEPLRFVQVSLLGDAAAPSQLLGAPPMGVGAGEITVLTPVEPVELAATDYLHLFVMRGTVEASGHTLRTGDSVRAGGEPVTVAGDGDVLAWRSDRGP